MSIWLIALIGIVVTLVCGAADLVAYGWWLERRSDHVWPGETR